MKTVNSKELAHYFARVLVFISCVIQLASGQVACLEDLSADQKTKLSEYVRAKYRVAPAVSLRIAKDEGVDSSCYRRLIFETRSALAASTLVLYLAPDQRFLISELLDTSLNPREEERKENQEWLAGMAEGRVPTLGPRDATVTIVEFSVQCPYCKKFSQIVRQVSLPNENARLVFHHFPLDQHPWARAAARAAACAEMQSETAFWSLHDRLFADQAALTVDNIQQRATGYARDSKLNVDEFQTCLNNDLSLGAVLKDIDLANSNGVTATPTLFVNGRRVAGVMNAQELIDLIRQARANVAAVSQPASMTNLR